MAARTVCILLYPGVQSLDVTGPYEVFAGANQYRRARGKPPVYAVTLAARRPGIVRTESGLELHTAARFSARGRVDTLIIPGGSGSALVEQDAAVLAAIRRQASTARRIAGVCTGAFVLAAAGLLDGRRATTHWASCRELARRYPRIQVDPDPIYVHDGSIYTSAGVTAGIDLALALVEADHGRDLALTIARWLVLFLRRPANQRQFSTQLRAQVADRDTLRGVQGYLADHLGDDLNVARLARLATMSERNFARAFRTEIGVTPARYVVQLRLEAARQLLEDSGRSVEHIARECGFGTPETLRRVFLRELKTVPREYRRRFQAPPQAS